MTARLHTSGPEPISWAQARDALEAIDMDRVVVHGREPHQRVTVGELHRQLLMREITPNVVGAYLVVAGLPIRCDGGDR